MGLGDTRPPGPTAGGEQRPEGRKSEPGAAAVAGGARHLLERNEDGDLVSGIDADPGIDHGQQEEIVGALVVDADSSPGRRELDRIGKQVEEHLVELAPVGPDRSRGGAVLCPFRDQELVKACKPWPLTPLAYWPVVPRLTS